MENWDLKKLNKGIKDFDFIDFKLAQMASFAFGLMIIKLFPFLRRIGFKKILGLMVLSGARPAYKFLTQCDVNNEASDEASDEIPSEE